MNENAALWFVDRHVEQGRGDKVAFQAAWQGGRALTFSGLAEDSGKAASAFAHAGIHEKNELLCSSLIRSNSLCSTKPSKQKARSGTY